MNPDEWPGRFVADAEEVRTEPEAAGTEEVRIDDLAAREGVHLRDDAKDGVATEAPQEAPKVRKGWTPKPKPSAHLEKVTEEDLEQRLLRRFYDSIDQIPADKIADLLIEREKAKGRVPARVAKTATDDTPPDLADFQEKIATAVGARPGRSKMRRVK